MKKHLLGLRGAVLAVALALGCKGDPTVGLVGGVSTVTASLNYVTVNVGDSVLLNAAVRDAAGDPVPVAATFASASDAIATTAIVTAAPLVYTNFFLKGVSYGTTTIVVSAGGALDTITVHTYPASVKITGSTDSLDSGATRQMTVNPLDAAGNTIAVSDPFKWSSSDPSIVAVDSLTGLLTAASPGKATITLTGPGSPEDVTTTVDVPVKPGAFTGTLSAASGSAGQLITVTKAASDPAFDADVGATIGGADAFVINNTGTTIDVVVPPLGVAAPAPLVITNIGPDQLARLAAFASSSASLDDPFHPNNTDPTTTTQTVTANGNYFVVLHGGCTDGVASAAGAVCDKFISVTNSTGASITLSLEADWFSGSDVDLITCNATCSGSFGFGGATGANPEKATLVIAAGVTRMIYLNFWDPAGTSVNLVRVKVSGMP